MTVSATAALALALIGIACLFKQGIGAAIEIDWIKLHQRSTHDKEPVLAHEGNIWITG